MVKLKASSLVGLAENDAKTVECAFWGISTVEVMCGVLCRSSEPVVFVFTLIFSAKFNVGSYTVCLGSTCC